VQHPGPVVQGLEDVHVLVFQAEVEHADHVVQLQVPSDKHLRVMMSNKPWDTAAGVLMAREAGALVTVAAAPAVADELAVVIKSTTLSGQRA
jgi:hypothetical protein